MAKYTLTVNGIKHQVEADPDTPLLWAIRDLVGLTGTKFGCGMALCGACTVHINDQPVRSCSTPISTVKASKRITTIEGLSPDTSHPVQQAWIAEQVPQCGYCQSGMLMAAAALLRQQRRPSDAQIDAAITNLCRCGSYPAVRAGIHVAAERLARGAA